MAFPLHSDGTLSASRTLGRRPIVLTRLPHVGADDTRTAVSVSDAVVAESKPSAGTRQKNHFVDQRHSTRRSSSKPKEPAVKPTGPNGLGASLCQLHSQMAPFSGAIVALALVASASLLYWIIVSPTRVQIDYHNIDHETFETKAVELPKFVPRSTSSAVSKATDHDLPWLEFSQTTSENSLTSLQPEQTIPSPEEPIEQTSSAPEAPDSTSGETLYPTTDHPEALDFAKIEPRVDEGAPEKKVGLEPHPEVASRSVPQLLTPTRR